MADPVVKAVGEQREGTHADEIETTIKLYIAPLRGHDEGDEDFPTGTGAWTPVKSNTRNLFGQRHLWGRDSGDAAKGEKVVKATIAGILKDIEELRSLRRP